MMMIRQSMADLFNQTPIWIIWEVFSQIAVTVQRLFTQKMSPLYISQVVIYMSELIRRERKYTSIEIGIDLDFVDWESGVLPLIYRFPLVTPNLECQIN